VSVTDLVPPTATQDRTAAGGPPVRRCGPLSLLGASVLPVAGSLAVDTWRVGAVALAVQLLLLPLAVRGWRALLPRLVPVTIAAVSVGWSTWLLGGEADPVAAAVASVLRIAVLVLPGVVLLAWLDPSETGDHLAQRLHLPARAVVAATAALEQLTALAQAWDELSRARRARGLGPGRGPVSRVRWAASTAFGLLVEGLRRAARVSVAMDARGFADAAGRSWALPARWALADTVLLVVGALVAAVPLVATALLG